MNIQPILIIGLILAALLDAVAALFYRRKGMKRGQWYATIGAFVAFLLGYALIGFFGIFSQSITAILALFLATLSLVTALRWRPRNG
jgi:hypothetical protein